MENFFVFAGVAILALMIPIIYRILVGPTAIDRIVAVNVIGTKTTVLLIVIGMLYERVGMFVDFALTYALLNFVGSLAAAKFFDRVNPAKSFSTMKAEEPQE
ncbi:MAG: pH regulation protein F [Opitutaceae bacterium]|nr:pH regulation protein F [Opitutaceae bacterium]|tara:strand:+ start:12997 stop:13302 length:306 start_codon:yes stop_codon:yes gene_type:complete